MVSYFPVSYFAPHYFRLVDPIQPPTVTSAIPNDQLVFSRIATALADTREFANVAFPEEAEQVALSSQLAPTMTILPLSWEETEGSTPDTVLRTVRYRLLLSIRIAYSRNGIARLSRLGNLCQNLLDNTDLGGTTLSGRTRMTSGAYQCEFPEARMKLEGEFAYELRRTQGRDTVLHT